MKKLRIWSMVIMLVALIMPMLVACGDDGESSGGGGDRDGDLISNAIGTWMCTQSIDTGQGQTYQGLMVGKEVTINANGTYTSTSQSFGYTGTYAVSGNKITARSNNGSTFVLIVSINGDRMKWDGTASNGVTFNYVFVKEDNVSQQTIIPITKEMISGTAWTVNSFTIERGSSNSVQNGITIVFYSDGTCKGFHSMETAWRINSGRIETYYQKTNEPMFVYTLLSQSGDEVKIRMNGTLDNDLQATLALTKTPYKVTLTFDPPRMTEQAAKYGITDLSIDKTEAGLSVSALLTSISVTESGKAVVEFLLNGKKKCATYDAQLTGDVYVITDGNKVVGKFSMAKPVAMAPTRSTSEAQMYITLEIEVPGVGTLKFDTAETPIVVSKMVDAITTGGPSLTNIARTWKVAQMKLSLDGDITPLSMLEESGKLSVFVAEIKKRNTGFTEEDIDKLNKEIKSISLDKNGMLSIEYTEGLSDAAAWNWDAADFSKIGIQLRDSEMGNKFLSDNSSINVQFNNVGCTFTLTTNLEGSNNNKYIATLVLVLMQAE